LEVAEPVPDIRTEARALVTTVHVSWIVKGDISRELPIVDGNLWAIIEKLMF
jgi:hypothetical protein